MKSIFLTEMGFTGKIPNNHPNMRTEFAWMNALDSDHAPIVTFDQIKGYDWVFVIPPKGGTSLTCEGVELVKKPNRYSNLYRVPLIQTLKTNNGKVAFVQEGPVSYVNDFDVTDQFNFYNQLFDCDALFAHNEIDKKWYSGLYPGKPVHVMPTLLIEDTISYLHNIRKKPEIKAIIGGNFCRWYGGFQSYLIASELECPIYVPSMHCKRPNEDQVPNLNHLQYMQWTEWMSVLSTFSYGIHMMPTVAAGTFSLNCAYFGIPCIGNVDVDTQRICFPELSFRAENVEDSRQVAIRLKDPDYAENIGRIAKEAYQIHFGIDTYKRKLNNLLQ